MTLQAKLKDHNHICQHCGRQKACPTDCKGESSAIPQCEICAGYAESGLPIRVEDLTVSRATLRESAPTCEICNAALGEPEIALSRHWHFTCERCHYCGAEMPNHSQIEKCLTEKIPVSHTSCHNARMLADFKNNQFPISRQHIQYLNHQICDFFKTIVNPDSTDVIALQDHLIALQDAAVEVSIVLGLTKDKIRIDSISWDQKTRATKQKAEREAALETEKEKIASAERVARQKAERENPRLRDRRKAVEGFIAMGIPREQAEAMVPQLKPETPTVQ